MDMFSSARVALRRSLAVVPRANSTGAGGLRRATEGRSLQRLLHGQTMGRQGEKLRGTLETALTGHVPIHLPQAASFGAAFGKPRMNNPRQVISTARSSRASSPPMDSDSTGYLYLTPILLIHFILDLLG
ncbi:hypothetical protein BAE44_0018555 [Dichanthelium oligosanthes]|uniref:Uncharacterized protein n=1 Tax=Dichanthelium oligosanthes TaxID=888268 RepID=A0A1E5V5I6_9POAL|nr:hypothetical protein BAE44_0018555 [Dichanthelium oligosanthes]